MTHAFVLLNHPDLKKEIIKCIKKLIVKKIKNRQRFPKLGFVNQ